MVHSSCPLLALSESGSWLFSILPSVFLLMTRSIWKASMSYLSLPSLQSREHYLVHNGSLPICWMCFSSCFLFTHCLYSPVLYACQLCVFCPFSLLRLCSRLLLVIHRWIPAPVTSPEHVWIPWQSRPPAKLWEPIKTPQLQFSSSGNFSNHCLLHSIPSSHVCFEVPSC